MTSGAPVKSGAAGPEQVRDGVGDLGRLEQALERLRREEDVLEHALLGDPVRTGLVGDLLLDERGPHVARADGARTDPDRRPSSASVFTRPSTPCFAETYPALNGEATSPCTEATTTIRPFPDSRSAGHA